MSRKILIIDGSEIMRRIIKGMILANVSDVETIEAENVPAAKKKVIQDKIHLILYSWEKSEMQGLNAFREELKTLGANQPIFVLMISQNQEEYVKEALKEDMEYIIIPCSPKELSGRINLLCDPVTLRSAKRYSLHDSSVILQQRGEEFPGLLINISSGGLLCELDFKESFNLAHPLNIQAKIIMDDQLITIPDIYARLVRLQVFETYPDFSPKKIRAAFESVQAPSEENKKLLEKIFSWAEKNERMPNPE